MIPRFVPTTPDTVKHSMTPSAYVPPDSPAPFAAGGSQCRRSPAEGSANESTSAAQRSANESAGAAPRSQSWPPPPAVTYTALLSASSCGDVTNGVGEGGGGGGREVRGGGLPIQQPQHKGKCNIDQITIKTPNPKCRLYWFLIEFIHWRFNQSCWYFRPAL